MSSEQKVGRRKFVGVAGGAVVGAIVGGAITYLSLPPRLETVTKTEQITVTQTQTTTQTQTIATATETPSRTGAYGGTLTVAHQADPTLFNPLNLGVVNGVLLSNIFQSPVDRTWEGQNVPSLAESWTFANDGLTATFNLVKNAKWHDGQPFTSNDIENNIYAYIKWQPTVGITFQNIDKIDLPDDYTVNFKFKKPQPPKIFLAFAANFYGMVLPKHLYDVNVVEDHRKVPESTAEKPPIGTGPFRFKEYVKGSHIILEKNPEYWKKGLPYLDRIIFRPIPDPSSALLALEKGEVDLVWGAGHPIADVKRLLDTPNIEGVTDMGGGQDTIYFNLSREPMSNLKFRQAVAYALDRKVMVDRVYLGQRSVSDSFYPAAGWTAYINNPNITKYAYDPAKANALLDEIGLKPGSDGIRVKLQATLWSARITWVQLTELIRENLKEVGIDLEIVTQDRATWVEQFLKNHNYDIAIANTETGPDPIFGQLNLHSKFAHLSVPSTNDSSEYSNPEVDSLFDAAATEVDDSKTKQIYYKIQEIVARDLPVLPINSIFWEVLWKVNVQGLPQTTTNHYICRQMDEIWAK